MSYSSTSGDGGMIAAMQATFDKALNADGYKDGAFRGLTNASTPPIDSLNILLTSNLVTEQEKSKAFRPWKEALVRFYDINPAAINPFQMIMLMMRCHEWCEVFSDDARSRGAYVPPTMIQTLNNDGTVAETRTVEQNGNVSSNPGGREKRDSPPAKVFGAAEARHMEKERKEMQQRDFTICSFEPRDRMEAWEAQREEWLANHSIDDVDAEDDETDTEEQPTQTGGIRVNPNPDKEGLDRKGRRAAAKAAKKDAKKMGKNGASLRRADRGASQD